jgi:hypothetical protein
MIDGVFVAVDEVLMDHLFHGGDLNGFHKVISFSINELLIVKRTLIVDDQ